MTVRTHEDGWVTLKYEGSVCWNPSEQRKTLELHEMAAFLLAREDLVIINPPNWFVVCNDVFAWGCADLEPIDMSYAAIGELFLMVVENEKCGAVRWCCFKRNERPQAPVEKFLRDNGGWDEKMDALRPNYYDTKRMEARAAA